MKQLLLLLALGGILMQTCSRMVVFLEYKVNREYIAMNLCENRDKPELRCNGRCHLRKQLEKNEKREQAPANNVKEQHEILFFRNHDVVSLKVFESATQLFSFFENKKTVSLPVSIFHPPSC